jgi:hypothetical protein
MNELLHLLSSGTLQSDGRASEVADGVLKDPGLFDLLVDGLSEEDEVIRGRTAHALERISRTQPEWVVELLPQLLDQALIDPVPMVRWHLAMTFANLPIPPSQADGIFTTLYRMLKDPSVLVKSWAIVSLTLLSRRYETRRLEILKELQVLADDPSLAIRNRINKTKKILLDVNEPIPAGWIKAGKE